MEEQKSVRFDLTRHTNVGTDEARKIFAKVTAIKKYCTSVPELYDEAVKVELDGLSDEGRRLLWLVVGDLISGNEQEEPSFKTAHDIVGKILFEVLNERKNNGSLPKGGKILVSSAVENELWNIQNSLEELSKKTCRLINENFEVEKTKEFLGAEKSDDVVFKDEIAGAEARRESGNKEEANL